MGPWGGRRDAKTVLTVLVKVDRGSISTENTGGSAADGAQPVSDKESEALLWKPTIRASLLLDAAGKSRAAP